jgi:hypothetical protein
MLLEKFTEFTNFDIAEVLSSLTILVKNICQKGFDVRGILFVSLTFAANSHHEFKVSFVNQKFEAVVIFDKFLKN